MEDDLKKMKKMEDDLKKQMEEDLNFIFFKWKTIYKKKHQLAVTPL